ncbi:carotenoid oxygenase family protein [Williamsia sterculiae]|uniref:Dioxygenase n=1 Tax=Williamsia sterculiae TaxID=1344003 RepID=A0A1N7FFT3_9NOCA|nr:carotenoid oxygenase family protein [Williamsia sterculiae]SIR99086.1 carotenoid cleavage dioxygenase [Williamsia sterculiae]
MSQNEFYLQGNYAPVSDERAAFDLPVSGDIPPELDGHYLRNGPNPRRPEDHWFAGDGMVHGVHLEGGRARSYRNRYIRTESFTDPFPLYNADGTRNLHASVANTHVVGHAGKILALVESSLPYEITADLATVGCYDFGGALADSMTAHPKTCPDTGELHFFGYGNLHEPYVTYHRATPDGELVVEQPVDVPALTMMHDFCLTADYVIFLDLPVVFDMTLALGGAAMPYRWDDDYGARMGVMRRDDPSAPLRWFDIAPCYVFHTANAYQRDHAIVITGVRYEELWRTDGNDFAHPSHLWEWTLDLRTGIARERQLDDVDTEFPRINDALTGRPTDLVYTAADHALLRYDLAANTISRHDFGDDEPGEATFIARSDAEGDGYLMSYVYRPATDLSDLVILDAGDLGAAPLATVHLPQRVPRGFHGNWFGG